MTAWLGRSLRGHPRSQLGGHTRGSPVDGEEGGQAVVPQQQQRGQPACHEVRAGVETCGDASVSGGALPVLPAPRKPGWHSVRLPGRTERP